MTVQLAEKAALFAARRRELGIVAPAPPPPPAAPPRAPLARVRPSLRPDLDPARQLELIAAYRRGSQGAARVLLDAYEPMIRGYASAFGRRGGDADEAAQCGRIALMKAANRHETTRGAFAAYAWHYIYFAMLRSAKATSLDGAESIDVPLFDNDCPMVERTPSPWADPETILLAKEEHLS